jgi:4-hydroxybenzoate polyprenyltransferase
MAASPQASATPDSEASWVDWLPARAAAYARLARFDRPVGIWLLFWPCLVGAFLASPEGWWRGWPLFLIGAAAMRAAGCVYNDIVDRDLDARVARTAARPVASGAIPVRSAILFLVGLALVGFGVLLALPGQARLVALASLLLVAAYPFMKRITWWPQAWLGLTFNWGVPVGWAAADPALRADMGVMLLVYAGLVAWTLGYDSIYALQDREDDALAGIRSSARRLGARVRAGVAAFYAAAIGLVAIGLLIVSPSLLPLPFLLAAALVLGWQVVRLPRDPAPIVLRLFRANHAVGFLFALAALASGLGVSDAG